MNDRPSSEETRDRNGGPSGIAGPVAGYSARFGAPPVIVVRAPGRVNLIGEHTDYNGLPVLPFAIQHAHRIAAAEGDGSSIDLVNHDPRYGQRRIDVDNLAAMAPAGDWGNYCRAALLGLVESGLLDRPRLERGLKIRVSSDLPAGAGLSSSSALVVGFALAALEVFQAPYDRLQLAEILAEAERHVGTRGGGMDQAICLFGRAGHAVKIDFFPLAVEALPFPDNVCVYLADSGVRVEKSGAARELYNERPNECRMALELFHSWARTHGQPDLASIELWSGLVKPPIGFSPEEALRMIRKALPDLGCSATGSRPLPSANRRKRMRRHSLDVPDLTSALPRRQTGEPDTPESSRGFCFRQRAEHVIAEGARVERAASALRQGDWPRLAALIDESHASCRDLYEISHPELERLVAQAAEAGALASRLTGAGFGGCTLHLVKRTRAKQFERAMKARLRSGQSLIEVKPSSGAAATRVADAG